MSAAVKKERKVNSSKGKKSTSVTFETEIITPEKAIEYLATSKLRGDPKKGTPVDANDTDTFLTGDPSTVKIYATTMRSGGWLQNGLSIKFDTDGNLIDGIHRLEACVMAGVPFTTIVARNVRADTLHTIDQQRKRSYTGVLEARGIKSPGALQKAMSKLIRIENGDLGIRAEKIPWPQFDRVLEANEELIEAIEISEQFRGSLLHSTSRPVLCFMALRANKKSVLMDFMNGLSNIDAFELGHPIRMLALTLKTDHDNYHKAVRRNREYKRMHVDTTLAISIMAFNDVLGYSRMEETYYWEPEYGDADPSIRKEVREMAPANLGLPQMLGFKGTRDAKYKLSGVIEDYTGQLAEELKAAREETEKSGSAPVVVDTRTITPEIATKFLKTFNTSNRKLERKHALAISRDITAGNWMFNAEPICFTADPFRPGANAENTRLLNGQHRLEACRIADQPIEVPIGVNITEAAFATYDIHSNRRKFGAEKTMNRAEAATLDAALKLIWKYENGIRPSQRGKPSASEIKTLSEKNPGLLNHFSEARKFHKLASASVMMFMIHLAKTQAPDIADDFLEGLGSGANLSARDPILALRSKINDRSKKHMGRNQVTEFLLDSWEDYKEFRKESELDLKLM